MTIVYLARVASWLCVVVILCLSLAPGDLRPHTGASGHLEHFAAYAGTGFLFAIGASLRARIMAAIGLCALSGGMEIAQLDIPGRTGEFGGFFYSTLGAWLGLVVGVVLWAIWLARERQPA